MKSQKTTAFLNNWWTGSPNAYLPPLIILGILLFPLCISTPFYQNLLILIFLNATLATAWNILGGLTGQLSLGHAAFFGIGAYTSTLLFVGAKISPLLGAGIGMFVCAAFAFLIGYPFLRLRGVYFVLATLAIAEVLRIVASSWRSVTKGSMGLFIPMEANWTNLVFVNRLTYVYLMLIFTLFTVGLSVWFWHSKLGYQLRCVREDESAAEAIGLNTTSMKIIALVISAALTAVCGTFYAQYIFFIDPDSLFHVNVSIQISLAAIVGGMGNPLGPAVGSVILTPIQELLRGWLGGAYQGLYGIVYGGALVIIVMLLPGGIIRWVTMIYIRLLALCPVLFRNMATSKETTLPLYNVVDSGYRRNPGSPPCEIVLEVRKVWKHFGGISAITDVSINVKRGEILGLIGPNGAGKTTLFNLIAGAHSPSKGDIIFAGTKLPQRRAPHIASRLGIGRTFQLVKPFERLPVLDNVIPAALLRTRSFQEAKSTSLAILESVGLSAGKHSRLARELNLADRKRLEIARALATGPQLLLLDEVMSGLNPNEVEEMLGLIRKIREGGTTILMVEHMMHAIMSVSDRIIVLHYGEMIAEGVPSDIAKDKRVIQVYLGRRYETRGSSRVG